MKYHMISNTSRSLIHSHSLSCIQNGITYTCTTKYKGLQAIPKILLSCKLIPSHTCPNSQPTQSSTRELSKETEDRQKRGSDIRLVWEELSQNIAYKSYMYSSQYGKGTSDIYVTIYLTPFSTCNQRVSTEIQHHNYAIRTRIHIHTMNHKDINAIIISHLSRGPKVTGTYSRSLSLVKSKHTKGHGNRWVGS